MSQPRTQHYTFAHIALPQLAYSDITRLLGILSSPDGQNFLLGLWQHIGSQLPPEQSLPPAGLRYSLTAIDDRQIILVTLPEPEAMSEAYFVALVVQPGGNDRSASLLNYFTLELSFSFSSEGQSTVVGGWDAHGTHFNDGAGPEPAEAAFIETITSRLSR